MKRKALSTILVLLLFLVGLGILMYPTISDRWNKARAARLVVEYDAIIAQSDEAEIENLRNVSSAYNRTLIGNILPDAFAELQLPPDATYDSMLNPAGSGYMGTVDIPKIDVHIPIYHYTTEKVLEKGAGHLAGSSLPIGGTDTHAVISAHRGLPSAKLFTDLDKMQEGDVFFLHVLGETLAYEVNFIKVIEPTDTEDLSIIRGEDLCTLFTCTPYAVNTHRLLVRGSRIPYTEDVYEAEAKKPVPVDGVSVAIRVLCGQAGLLLAAIVIFLINMTGKRRAEKAALTSGGKEEKDDENTAAPARETESSETDMKGSSKEDPQGVTDKE